MSHTQLVIRIRAVHTGIVFTAVCLCTCDEGQALHSCEISVFDGHHASGGKQLLRVVIDQLSEDPQHTNTHSFTILGFYLVKTITLKRQ